MAYTAHQYRLQDAVMRDVRYAGTSGLCPVCRVRPSGVWPDGAGRVTCGAQECFIRWLPVKGHIITTKEESDQ